MKKSQSYYRTAGRAKGGTPIIQRMDIGGAKTSRSFAFLKYFLIIGFLCLLGYFLYYLHINGVIVWFNRALKTDTTLIFIGFHVADTEFEHYLWNILNVLLIGVFLSAIAPLSGRKPFAVSVILIVAVYAIGILNLGYVGLELFLNFDFLTNKVYISNAREGVEFFISNFAFFLMVFAVSFLIEAETE